MKNRLNVYILTYNRAQYLSKSIESVLYQSYRDFDLYVLDNASTDHTEQVVKQFSDPRLHYIRHEKNLGSFGNTTFAIEHCSSEFYVVFHDDDIMHFEMLEKELTFLIEHPDCAIVSVLNNTIDQEGMLSREIESEPGKVEVISGNEMFYGYLHNHKNLTYPAIMYRNDYIKQHHIRPNVDAGPCADVVLCFDIARYGGKIAELQESLMDYRVHTMQDSSMNFGIMLRKLLEFLREDAYYSELLRQDVEGQRRYFRWLISKSVIRVASGAIDIDTGLREVNDYSRLLDYRKVDFAVGKGILTIQKFIPGLFRWGYQIAKKRKK